MVMVSYSPGCPETHHVTENDPEAVTLAWNSQVLGLKAGGVITPSGISQSEYTQGSVKTRGREHRI